MKGSTTSRLAAWMLLLLLFFVHCSHHKMKSGIISGLRQAANEFGVHQLSYLVAIGGQIVDEQYTNQTLAMGSASDSIVCSFAYPLMLKRWIKQSLINGNDSLGRLLNDSTVEHATVGDLLMLPADKGASSGLNNPEQCTKLMGRLIQHEYTQQKGVDMKASAWKGIDTSAVADVKGLFKRLSALFSTFDADNMEYASIQSDRIVNIFPNWYTKNVIRFFGWHVLKLNNQLILWNCFKSNGNTILLLKFMDADTFVALAYTSSSICDPFSFQKQDLLQSPLALSMVRSVLYPDSYKHIRYNDSWNDVKQDIQAGEQDRLLYLEDLLAHARYYEQNGKKELATRLYKGYGELTGDTILVKYLNRNILAETGPVANEMNGIIPFSLDTASYVQLFAGGQSLNVSDYQYDNNYNYDNIQLFLSREKPDGNRNGLEQTIEFNYRFNQIWHSSAEHPQGWRSDMPIRFAWADPSDTSYVLEAAIPWEVLGGLPEGASGNSILLNVFVGDSDMEENKRKSVLSWAVAPGQEFYNTAVYGRICLSPSKVIKDQPLCKTPKVIQGPLIDGRVDDIWSKTDSNEVPKVYLGNVGIADNAAWFKSCYDSHFLYLLFNVMDNCKNQTGIITKDRCWIEDLSNGTIRWKLKTADQPEYPTVSEQRTVFLPAGRYLLHYRSDRSHSSEKWVGPGPADGIYGTVLYKAE